MKIHRLGNDYAYQQELKQSEETSKKVVQHDNNQVQDGGAGAVAEPQAEAPTAPEAKKKGSKKTAKEAQE